MPDIKHNFTGGKMNKDLDERLVPNGEYRDAMNIQVQTSEGSEVGTIQNILGNNFGCDYTNPNFNNPVPTGSTTVGSVSDEKNDSLYWLVAGPGDDGSCTSLSAGAECSFKDVIMRTNTSTIGCEPVFVDNYGWCLGIDPTSGSQNTIPIDPTVISNVTLGMSMTGYNNGVQEFTTLVTGIGPSNSIPMLGYYQGSDTITPIAITNTWSVKLRLFAEEGCAGFSGVSYMDQTPCFSYGGPQQNIPPNGSSQIFLPSINQDVVVGATVSHVGFYTNGGTITDIQYGQICTGYNSMSGCTTQYILTIDELPTAWPLASGFNSVPYDNEDPLLPFDINITVQPATTYIPNNTIHMLPGSDPWLDEIYNILYDSPGNLTGAQLEIDSFYGGGSNFPPNTCIDPASVINAADGFDLSANSYDDFFELIDCSTGASVDGLNMNPTNRPIRLIATNSVGVESVFLRDSVNLDFVDTLCFTSERVLNFEPNKLITGINIVDDMLFWTDGYHDAANKLQGTEPKKINITRSIQGTAFDGMTHTDLYVDGVSEGPIREEHVTVIRRAPLGPPTLEMSEQVRPGVLGGSEVSLSLDSINPPFFNKVENDTVWVGISKVGAQHPNFKIGDILRIQSDDGITPYALPNDYHLRLEIIDKQLGPFTDPLGSINIDDTKTAYLVKILTIANESTVGTAIEWYAGLEEGDSLFERKFPRFAYRYKYVDNEYSSFGPFSEVAFIPGSFIYEPISAYNLGMTNKLKSLIIKDFVSNETPKDVVQVDILYKNETSPTVYLLDSVARDDSTANWDTSSYEVSTESVFAALPTSQTLRSWDNVPKTATSQEVTGSRLVYGNYLQGYDIKQYSNTSTILQPSITASLASKIVDSADYTGRQSIKSLRTYDVGVVWGDKYGRETPVITSTGSSLTVPKSKSLDSSYLVADIDSSPHWADYYRFYVKETSNEYYNLPVDRVYDADDGNVWVSFPSVDRNKVDEDTYITLKKGINIDNFILEDARYKIVAIENEAPEYIKTTYERLARSNTDNSRHPHSCNMYAGSHSAAWPSECEFVSGHNPPEVGRKGFSLSINHWSGPYTTDTTAVGGVKMGLPSPKVLWQEVNANSGGSTTDELFVSFSKEITSGTGTTIQSSNKYHVVEVKDVEITDEPSVYYINLGSQIVADDFWVAPYNDSPQIDDEHGVNDNIHIHFWKKTIRNKPEFDGRFFVKIISDDTIANNLNSKDEVFRNFYVSASTNLYKIEDLLLSSTPGQPFDFTGPTASTHTRSESHWNSRLKFGGSSVTSNWFIDKACFASYAPGAAPYSLSNNGSSPPQTEFFNGVGPVASADTTSSITDTFTIWCGVVFEYNVESETLNVGTGAGEGRVGMKGVWSNSGAKYLDLSYANFAPVEYGSFGDTSAAGVPYVLDRFNPEEPSNGQSNVVSNLKTSTRFRLSGSQVIYKILGVTKFRLFNYQGVTTANHWHTNPGSGVNGVGWSTCTGASSTVQLPAQEALMLNNKNRRATYRIQYEVDTFASPDGTTVTAIDDTELDDGGQVITPYNSITNTDFVRIDFLEEFTVEGENPISENPAIFETEPKEDVDLDLYYEASSSLPTFPVTEKNKHLYIPIGATIVTPPIGSTLTPFPQGVFITGWQYIDPSSPVYTVNLSMQVTTTQFSSGLASQPYLVLLKDSGEIVQAEIIGGILDPTGTLVNGIRINPISRIGLSWFNCWSFNNGVESNRVGDTFNKPFLTNGATASTTTEERFKEEHRKYGLIYSGLYNSNSSVNSLNQFIAAEKITKDINPIYGSIQKLHSGWGQGGDLVALCEDRVLKILANKDALFNADGNSNITSTDKVLGQAIPYSGEFGISKNPESFASDAYRAYFTDKVRGTVVRLSMDGLTPISEHGMKDWFRDNLKLNNNLVGSYDDRQDKYNITLPITTEQSLPSILTARTVSFSERVKGWVSFKSFVPENGISCANNYYTFKDGNLYKHHDETVDRNTFYPTVGIPGNYTNSSFTVLINESPGTVKTFHTLNYEGSQSKIDQLVSQSTGTIGAYDTFLPTNPSVVDTTYNSDEYYNLSGEDGWYVHSIKTDLEEGSLNEFIEKEGKWFNYIKGIPGSITDGVNANGFSNYNISFQGLGRMAGSASVSSVFGCTDCGTTDSLTVPVYTYPNAVNCDPAATVDNGTCNATIVGCTDSMATVNYDPTANWDIWTNTGVLHSGACQYNGCTDPTATNYDAGANYNDGTCVFPVIGCMDTTAANYNVANDTPCDGFNDLLQPCVADASGVMQTITSNPLGCCCGPIILGCTDPLADNYDPAANSDDGSCFNIFSGCTDGLACNYDDLANTDDGSCTYCDDDGANNYDGLNPDGSGNTLADCDDGCVYCKDPLFVQTTGNVSPSEIEISWQETLGSAPVEVYRVQYRITGTTTWTSINSAAPGGSPGNTINYGVSNLASNTSYEIRVKAKCVAGQSPHNPAHFSSSAWSNIITGSTSFVPIPGCQDDQGFSNPLGNWPGCDYNPSATVDDGCDYNSCHGCMNSAYEEFCDTCWDSVNQVVVTDGSGGPWLGELGANPYGLAPDCITPWILGCTDASAFNYDPNATQDDGSCVPPILGCMDNTTLTHDGSMQSPNSGNLALAATNYAGPGSGVLPEANTDDGSCTYIMPTFSNWYGLDPSEFVNPNNTRLWVIWDITGIPQFNDTSMSLGFSNAWNSPTLNYVTASGSTNIVNPTPTTLRVAAYSSGNVSDFSNSGNNGDFSQALVFVFNNPNIPAYTTPTETFTVQNLPGCLDPLATCNYPTDPALLATFSNNSTCIYPSGCSDPLSYTYDAAVTCGDPNDCVYCATDPDVVNATLTTITPNNMHTINWADMGTYNTNGTNTDEVQIGSSLKPAYEVLYKYKPLGGSWTSSWATMIVNPFGMTYTATNTIPLPAPCNGNSGRQILPSGIVLDYTNVGISGSTGAFNTGAKWKLKVRNYCTDCSDGGYMTTPILQIT